MNFSSDSAKQFLLLKVADQAHRDGVSFDEVEQKMFVFSESSDSVDLDAQEVFDQKFDANDYESKVTKLIRKAYSRDKKTKDRKQEWAGALNALKQEDFYGLVMIDQAGIPRSQDGEWQFYLQLLPFEIVELVVIALGFLVVFRPDVLGLNLPGWMRWLAYLLFIWLFWYISKVSYRVLAAKAVRRSKPSGR